MRMILISVITGLLVGMMFYLMLMPGPEGVPSVLRIIIYGGWAVITALWGMRAADRVRREDGRMWGEQ